MTQPANVVPIKAADLKVACSSCNLRELCLPVGFSNQELGRLDTMVATRRNADSRSGARLPSARHAPLNSSISAMIERKVGVMRSVWVWIISNLIPNNTHFLQPNSEPNYTH